MGAKTPTGWAVRGGVIRRSIKTKEGIEHPQLVAAAEWEWINKCLGLTPRQSDVARLLCQGCDSRAIAAQMRVSPNTVRMHMHMLLHRCGVRDRVGLVLAILAVQRAAGGVRKRSRGVLPRT